VTDSRRQSYIKYQLFMERTVYRILQKYDLTTTSLIDLSHKGYSGALIYHIKTEDNQFILKGYQPEIEVERILFVHKVMAHVYDHGFTAIPLIYKTTNGETTLTYQDRIWELSSVIQGKEKMDSFTDDDIAKLGSFVGKFHLATQGFSETEAYKRAKRTTSEQIHSEYERLTSLIKHNHGLLMKNGTETKVKEFLDQSDYFLQNVILKTDWDGLQNNIPYSIVHRDLWRANIFFKNDSPSGIIDFLLTRWGSRLDDVGRVIQDFCDLDHSRTKTFLEQYNKIFPLNSAEEDLLVPWMLQGNIFGTFWHIEQYLKQENTRLGKEDNLSQNLELALTIFKNARALNV